MKIFLDLDGVLANFNLQLNTYMKNLGLEAYKEPNQSWAEFESKNQISIFTLLYSKLSKAEILTFWATIPAYSWNRKITELYKDHKIEVLTALPKPQQGFQDECKFGKLYWVETNLPGIKTNLCSREEKKLFATEDSLLIDD